MALGDMVLLALLLLAVPDGARGDTLEVLEDADLDKLIRQEQYVIVLFGEDWHVLGEKSGIAVRWKFLKTSFFSLTQPPTAMTTARRTSRPSWPR